MAKQVRLAAGRARALGVPTRGTTNPNRLRRMDNWIAVTCGAALSAAVDPLVVDLGYGASAVTAIELASRLRPVRADVRVLGLEIDPERVAAARPAADPPRLDFARGGFELAGHRPVIVRAANVLRQYPPEEVDAAWAAMRAGLVPGGSIVEGTCDEIGRLGSWIRLDEHGPRSLTIAVRLETLQRPSDVAARLPKALIHRNVPGEPVHDLLVALDRAWDTAASVASFGPRQRWTRAAATVAESWPVLDRIARWRLGEITVDWTAVAPARTEPG